MMKMIMKKKIIIERGNERSYETSDLVMEWGCPLLPCGGRCPRRRPDLTCLYHKKCGLPYQWTLDHDFIIFNIILLVIY
jgi:hypothetical protein